MSFDLSAYEAVRAYDEDAGDDERASAIAALEANEDDKPYDADVAVKADVALTADVAVFDWRACDEEIAVRDAVAF